MSLSREEYIYMAKIAEQTERFEDMLDYMKKVVHAE
jgi:14-3-3 protein epsilon